MLCLPCAAPQLSASSPLRPLWWMVHKARDGPPAKAKHAGCKPIKSQHTSKPRAETASFAGEPALSKLAARGAAACGWAVCANGTHGEAKDDAIRLCLALAAAARQQTQRRKPVAVQWPRDRAGHLDTSQDPPAWPPAQPTHRKKTRRNGDHTTVYIFHRHLSP